MLRTTALRLSFALLAGALCACRDDSALAIPHPAEQRAARLDATTSDSIVTVSLRLAGFREGRVASVVAAIDYDSTRMEYAGEIPLQDGGIRATRANRGRVMVAVAHASGLPDEVAAALRFVAKTSDPTHGLGLTMREVQLLDASSGLPGLLVSPASTMLRQRGDR